jgi:hypothetical protein
MATTTRGHIEEMPSGAFRVHVYAGTDPVTGKPRRRREAADRARSMKSIIFPAPILPTDLLTTDVNNLGFEADQAAAHSACEQATTL